MNCWCQLFFLNAFVQGSQQDEQEVGSQESQVWGYIALTQPAPRSSFQVHQPSFDLDQIPSPGSWQYERQPSFDDYWPPPSPHRRSPQPDFSLERFRSENMIEIYQDSPDELFRTLNFDAVKSLFMSEPEKQFLLANKRSPVLAEILANFETLTASLEFVDVEFTAFVVEVLDEAGKLESDELLRYYDIFNDEIRSPEFGRKFITLLTPIQAEFDYEGHIILSGIEFEAAHFVTDEQFYVWNVSSWLLHRKLTLLAPEAYSQQKNILFEKICKIRETTGKALRNAAWIAAFETLESFDQFFNVADAAYTWFGFGSEAFEDYDNLSTTKRIQFRFLIYLCILFPHQEANRGLLSAIFPKVAAYKRGQDLCAEEVQFLCDLCIQNSQLGSLVLNHYSVRYPNSKVTKCIKKSLTAKHLEAFANPVSPVYLAINHDQGKRLILQEESLFKTCRVRNDLKKRNSKDISMTRLACIDEATEEVDLLSRTAIACPVQMEFPKSDYEQEISMTGRKRTMDSGSASSSKRHIIDLFADHFLTENEIASLIFADGKNVFFQARIRLLYPDRTYFEDRLDNFLQNLSKPSFGEIEWAAAGKANQQKDSEIKAFIEGALPLIQALSQGPLDLVDVAFTGSGSFGKGLALEALSLLGRACVLPFVELFYYDVALKGFVPLPLLAPEMMSFLGALSGLLIKYDMPVDWMFAPEYLAFLHYAESYDESVADLATRLYAPILENYDKMAACAESGDLLDSLPTTFASHFPFRIARIPARPLNLYSYDVSVKPSPFMRMDVLLNERSCKLLRVPAFDDSQEGQTEGESKSADLTDSRKVQARKALVSVVKSVLADEIALRLKQGRFEFQRHFLGNFSSKFHELLDFDRMTSFWKSVKLPFTAENMVCGLEFVNGKEFEVVVNGSATRIGADEAFKQIIAECSNEDLQQFYWFSTGCHQLPVNGLDSNPISVRFLHNRMSLAQTCFRECHIGAFSPISLMKERFLFSIYNTVDYDLSGENRR
jgi:hypothetical protein